jgi:archaeal flagellin FlaB
MWELSFMDEKKYTEDKFMIREKNKNEGAFTGLEAAIVLIAFVVVAAVFSYVVLGAGFYTTQKTQETVYKSVEQATSNLQMEGQVYGVDSGSTSSVNIVKFGIGYAPGAPPMDITRMVIVVTQPDQNLNVQTLTYSTTAVAGSTYGFGSDGVTIALSPGLGINQKITVEIRPAVGSALLFTRTAPATLTYSQVLY